MYKIIEYNFAHSCQHHCEPRDKGCSNCGEHVARLRECSKCESRFCDKCCLRYDKRLEETKVTAFFVPNK
jgi:predicted amidophosphoribosyltransferase